jgi:hypothetical protein
LRLRNLRKGKESRMERRQDEKAAGWKGGRMERRKDGESGGRKTAKMKNREDEGPRRRKIRRKKTGAGKIARTVDPEEEKQDRTRP